MLHARLRSKETFTDLPHSPKFVRTRPRASRVRSLGRAHWAVAAVPGSGAWWILRWSFSAGCRQLQTEGNARPSHHQGTANARASITWASTLGPEGRHLWAELRAPSPNGNCFLSVPILLGLRAHELGTPKRKSPQWRATRHPRRNGHVFFSAAGSVPAGCLFVFWTVGPSCKESNHRTIVFLTSIPTRMPASHGFLPRTSIT